MRYEVYWADKKALKSFESVPSFLQDRMVDAIKSLAANPRPSDTKKLAGKLQGTWRIRVGDYRILYDVDDKAKKVVILYIGHRRQIYR